jgi:hypothetical protein
MRFSASDFFESIIQVVQLCYGGAFAEAARYGWAA